MIIKIHPENPQPRLIKKASQTLQDGGIVVFPTDTKYSVGCDIFNKKAVEKLYQILHADKMKLFSVICTNFSELSKYAQIDNFAFKVMHQHLPGPYTFILSGRRILPKITLSKRKTIGLRMPDNKILLDLGKEYSGPILSAGIQGNNHGEHLDLWGVEKDLGHKIDLIIDGGLIPVADSSIIELIDDQVNVIREGKGDIGWFQ